jgi:hypothetical protein
MSELRLVHIRFRSAQHGSEAAQKAAWERAHAIAQWPGLVWKIWTYDPAGDQVGGTYLFQDPASAEAYLNGPIVASMQAGPGNSDFQATVLAVDVPRSEVTRGPVPYA